MQLHQGSDADTSEDFAVRNMGTCLDWRWNMNLTSNVFVSFHSFRAITITNLIMVAFQTLFLFAHFCAIIVDRLHDYSSKKFSSNKSMQRYKVCILKSSIITGNEQPNTATCVFWQQARLGCLWGYFADPDGSIIQQGACFFCFFFVLENRNRMGRRSPKVKKYVQNWQNTQWKVVMSFHLAVRRGWKG